MTLPNRYATAGPAGIATYDYSDLDDGIGYTNYLLADGTDQKVVMKGSLAVKANEGLTEFRLIEELSNVKVIDLDFDINFNTPKILKGLALFSFSHSLNMFTSGKNAESYFIIRVKKGEVVLASNESDHISVVGPGNWLSPEIATELLEIEIPETVFGSGDILRITVEGYLTGDVSADAWMVIGHEPTNTNVSEVSTQNALESGTQSKFVAQMPFKLNL